MTSMTPMTPPPRPVTVRSALGKGLLYGGGGGFVAGFVVPWVGAAIADWDAMALVVMLIYGWYSGAIGAAYGLVAGCLVALVASPFRNDRAALVRLRPVWALVSAAIVVALSLVLFGWKSEPGPNETSDHVLSDRLSFYLFPSIAAAATGAWLTPRIAPRDAHPGAQ